jgi:hypothetical protein
LSLPMVITNGNHDQFELGPWGHFFGSMYGTVKYDDLSLIKFDSTMPMGSGLLNWIGNRATSGRKDGPVLLACHYPLAFSYFTSGWTGLADLMVQNDITAILHGHTHADLNAEIETIRENYTEIALGISQSEDEYDFGSLFEVFKTDPSKPISAPQMIVTRSAGKPSRIEVFEDLFPGVEQYSGYRLLTLSGNKVVNYTYDYDNDGVRDPFLSTPNGRLNVSYTYDPLYGIGLPGNLTWNLFNNMTEDIPAARAIFKIHNPIPGNTWNLSPLNITNGAYIRTMISDGTTTWIDARVFAPEQDFVSLRLEQVPIGGGS